MGMRQLSVRLDEDAFLALDERAKAAKLQPCGIATMARAVLRAALGLPPAPGLPQPEPPGNALQVLAPLLAGDLPPARAATRDPALNAKLDTAKALAGPRTRHLAVTTRCPTCSLLSTQCRGHTPSRQTEPPPWPEEEPKW